MMSPANEYVVKPVAEQFINGLNSGLESMKLGGSNWTLKTDVGPCRPKVPHNNSRSSTEDRSKQGHSQFSVEGDNRKEHSLIQPILTGVTPRMPS